MTSARFAAFVAVLGSAFALTSCFVSFDDFPVGQLGAGGNASFAGGAGDSPNGGSSGDSGTSANAGNAGNAGGAGAGASSSGGSAGAVAAGGNGAEPGAAGAGGGVTMPPADLMIDDFEDGDAQILPNAGRNGSWFVSNDGTPYSQQTPDGRGPVTPSSLMPPRGTSLRAMHTTGFGFKNFGAVIGANFVVAGPAVKPYDVSAHRGLSFVAKVGKATSSRMVRVSVRDQDTLNDCTVCGDHFGADITLGDAFATIQVPFSSFTQQGWGQPQLMAFDPTQAYAVTFSWGANQAFNVWIDDLSFY